MTFLKSKLHCSSASSVESQKERSVELIREKTGDKQHKAKYSSHTVGLEHCFCVMLCDLATCESLEFRTQARIARALIG